MPGYLQHCGLQRQTCEGVGAVTTKQRRKMEEIAALTMHPLPDADAMDFRYPWARLSFCCTLPLPLVGVSIAMERESQQNDRTLANGFNYRQADRFLAERFADWMIKDYPRY